MSISKVVSARDAVSVVRSGDVVASSGWGGHGVAEAVISALEQRFLEEGSPSGLTLVWAGGQGDGAGRGLDHLAHAGLLRRTIGGHYGLVPKLAKLAVDEEVEAYNLPEGVLLHLYRSIAAGSPGLLSTVGIGTFVDPRLEGGKVNRSAAADIVELSPRRDENWLFYRGFPIDVAIIRGTTADPLGNITAEREAVNLETLQLAMAARASGGYVICQVERIAESGSLDSRDVRVPAILVDAVVVAEDQHHEQTWGIPYDPALSGELRVPTLDVPRSTLDARTVIARRATLELRADDVVNLGLGIPELIGDVTREEHAHDLVTFMIDTGVIGGVPVSGFGFGAAVNRQALIDHVAAFDFIDGGGLDTVFLGVAECDARGNVNVSRFADRIAGCGGAINLTQRTRKVVFMTPFRSGGLQIDVADGSLAISAEGKVQKFVSDVEQITFSADVATEKRQSVLYLTERCVFRLGPDGLILSEIAPGIDLERDILAHLPFPVDASAVVTMDAALFKATPLLLRTRMLDLHLDERLAYDVDSNTVFMDYSGLHLRSPDDVTRIVAAVEALLAPLHARVHAVINYDRFQLDEAAIDAYADAVQYVQTRFYVPNGVTRHSTNAFMRLKLARELAQRDITDHIDAQP